MDNPFSWDYLTTVPGTNEVFGPFAIVFLAIFGVGFLVSVFFYNDGARRYTNHGLKRRLLRRGAAIALTVFGIGLFFFGIRVLQINPLGFGMRLWLYLSLLSVAVMAAYFAYYLRVVYPGELRAYEERRVKQRYLRSSPTGTSAVRTGGPRPAAAAAGADAAPVARRASKRRRQ